MQERRIVGESHKRHAQERFAGFLLIASALLALLCANTVLKGPYTHLLHMEVSPAMPGFAALDVEQWISEGLMAIFFLLVGLEVKREWLEGRLSHPPERRLPVVAAVAGMAVPALVFLIATGGDPMLDRGWAIPAATDIAFALGVLALLGPRASPAIKLLLVAIAIIDDIGAVAIIALAYTAELNGMAMAMSAVIVAVMATMSLFGIRSLWPYLAGFIVLWIAMHMSGVHATIAGVLAALTVPLAKGEGHSPLKKLEFKLHPYVMFGIVPLFGLASAGVEIDNVADLVQPLPLGVALGLFLGKQLGVFGAIWIACRTGFARRNRDTSWAQLYGASALCGIGFTMSLFIGNLAFPASPELADAAKIGVLAGSLAAGILGFLVLRFAAQMVPCVEDSEQAGEIFCAHLTQKWTALQAPPEPHLLEDKR